MPRYYVEVEHSGLGKHRIVTGSDPEIVHLKARAQVAEWEKVWQERQRVQQARAQKEQAKEEAAERTRIAQEAVAAARAVLAHTLSVDDAIDWGSLKDHSEFPKPKPSKPAIPPEPQASDERYRPRRTLLGFLLRSRKAAREAEARALFDAEHVQWVQSRDKSLHEHEEEVAAWEKEREDFLTEQQRNNERVDERCQRYLAKDPAAITDYCDMVLANSSYPDWMSPALEMDYLADTRTAVVDYQLPLIDALPRVKEVKYIQSADEFRETMLSDSEANQLYDSVLYQIALRTVHELFEADKAEALDAVAFNGWVHSIDKGTGQEFTACILSLHAARAQFCAINLARVDAKECFRSLKGAGSPKLHTLTPVAPLIEISREDRRFVQAHEVIAKLEEGENLATISWEDFEHLIRELFEKEFAQNGGEVKVTQASRDGGVDAVAFDPDPIRGGKIVIQAKRYTRTVGVSAVRDLYGTVVNEGATKGILVTTSDYGADAHEFAKGKPITLLTGAHLLHLLAKHGYKARVDLQEARRLEGRE